MYEEDDDLEEQSIRQARERSGKEPRRLRQEVRDGHREFQPGALGALETSQNFVVSAVRRIPRFS